MRRVSSWLLPAVLAVAGVTLIVIGQLSRGSGAASSLPPIPNPTATASPSAASPAGSQAPSTTGSASAPGSASETSGSGEPSPAATPTPIPVDVVAVQLEIAAVGINVAVEEAADPATCDFPPSDAAFILCASSQPGRGTNSYIFAHAINELFKPLWNVQLGAEVRVLMSDGSVLEYVVTEVRPNVPCPDAAADPHPNPPLALLYAPDNCSEGAEWTLPTDHERLTLQTSQGFNRNWGELVVIAEPAAP